MSKPVGILRFPGTNCDYDIMNWCQAKDIPGEFLWHQDRFQYQAYEALIVPGGFSFGDYLRSGALAARSSALQSVREAAEHGMPILGICNGFQILTEAGLLPGALVQNEHQRFLDTWVDLKVHSKKSFFAKDFKHVRLPIAHGDGRYFIPENEVKSLWDQEQVWMTYEGVNPNGSVGSIAGVLNAKKNVAGLMPHPERALFDWMGGVDGWGFI
jgi:phosphoribosylformylglycinamidine synthase I